MKLTKIFVTLACFATLTAQAQWTWTNPLKCGFPVVQNQGWTEEIGNSYTRLPQRAENKVRKAVWNLSRNSAGLAIYFYSDAPELKVRYTVSGALDMPHMPATGVSGMDLYSINSNGEWERYFGGYPCGWDGSCDTIQYHYTGIKKDRYHNKGYEFRLYLPLYNTVTWMEIGVPEGKNITFIPTSAEKPILLYGTSIAQGACASRPGMAWSNILQRSVDYPLVNLGFSGNGQLEKEVIAFINEIDARLYILDCLPNLTNRSEAEVQQLVYDAVRQIRDKHASPILLIEHAGYSNAPVNEKQYDIYTRLNKGSKKAWETLTAEGIKDLYYLSNEEINLQSDVWVDVVHPSDLGMKIQADAVERKVRDILHIPTGTISTTRPVTQRREPGSYEWLERHREIVDLNSEQPCQAVILGNSIIHYWGGVPATKWQRGTKSWDKFMKPAGFRNMGYGWDRIENVLWRVYHGEIDGFEAQKVVLAIGTNNLTENTDDEIIDGLDFLISAIIQRQPKASISILGILPRRNTETRIEMLNHRIKQIADNHHITFKNPGNNLLLKNGKINESLFTDGLHPNEEGYMRIVKEIKE